MNSRRYTMTSLSMVFLALTIMSVSTFGQNAYAGGMSLSVDCSGSVCDVSGTSDRTDLDVAIVLKSGNGIHDVAQATVSGGSYSATFNVSNLNDGTYTIEANQSISSSTGGAYVLFVDVDVSGGSSDSSVSRGIVVYVSWSRLRSRVPQGHLCHPWFSAHHGLPLGLRQLVDAHVEGLADRHLMGRILI